MHRWSMIYKEFSLKIYSGNTICLIALVLKASVDKIATLPSIPIGAEGVLRASVALRGIRKVCYFI